MTLKLDATPEDLQIWLPEAEEHLQLLDEELVRLERDASDPELLQEIFRAAHTLKGSSAAIKHHRMAQLTHALENVLDDLRNGVLSVSSSLVDVLLETLDALRILRDEVMTREENPDLDVAAITERLHALRAGGGTQAVAVAAPPSASPDFGGLTVAQLRALAVGQGVALDGARRKADIIAVLHASIHAAADAAQGEAAVTVDFGLNPAELQHARSMQVLDQTVQQLSVEILPASAMPAARCLQVLNEIWSLAKVLASRPTAERIMAEDVDTRLDILLVSNEDADKLEAAARSVFEIEAATVMAYFGDRDATEGGDERAAEHLNRVRNDGDRRTLDLGSEARGKSEREQLKMAAAKLNRMSQTVRIDIDRLENLMNLVGELVIDKTRLQQVSAELNARHSGQPAVVSLDQVALHVGRITDELQEEVMRSRMQPIETVFNKLPRLVRDLARDMQKTVEFVIEGKETELDRSVIEEIGDPLIHIIRNSVDHGIESPEARVAAGKPAEGTVHLSARHEENQIVIAVSDDGGGIDPERLRRKALETGQLTEEVAARLTDEEAVELVFRSGVSTATVVTDVSGRGVGMDIVRTNIEKLNGNVSVKSELGRGTVVEIRLPLTLAIVRALLIKLREETFAIPLTSVMESLERRPEEIFTAHGREMIRLRDDVLPLIRLGAFFAVGENGADLDGDADAPAASNENGSTNGHARTSIPVVAVKVGARRSSLAVDELLGEQEVVIKALGGFVGDARGIAGATILGDGRVAMIVDVNGVIQSGGAAA